ncbi:MAG: T9SS type A sorting domain-containing protein [Candidatus Cyclobacteriaceae bacterium M3_2C_046]
MEVVQEDNCKVIELKVTTNGNCAHALSHFTVEIPCGKVVSVYNSEGWDTESNSKDPTSELYGFKVDNIKDFGELDQVESFTVKFKVCEDEQDCFETFTDDCFSTTVAYKASTCVFYENIEQTCKEPLTASLNVSPVTCYGGMDGQASIVISSGNPPYQVQWSNGNDKLSQDQLKAGIYAVTITDSFDQTLALETVITEPTPLNIKGSVAPTACESNSGSISLEITGGVEPYQVTWENGSNMSHQEQLEAGSYQVIVNDQNFCNQSKTFEVTEDCGNKLAATIEPFPVSCYGGQDGQAKVLITSGNPPYTYQWSTNETSSAIEQLSAGNYSVLITDALGLTLDLSVQIDQPLPLNVQANLQKTSCNDATGKIDLSTTGGTAPYTYLWSNQETTSSISNLALGNYQVLVTDSKGCSVNKSYYIHSLPAFTISSSITATSCTNPDGSIDITLLGGLEPFSFKWSNGATTEDLTGLAEGGYSVQITDSNGCELTKYFYVYTNNNHFSANLYPSPTSCLDDQSGSIITEVTGGTLPYKYEWSNGATTKDLEQLGAGNYSLKITDLKGCTKELSAEVKQDKIQFIGTKTKPVCAGSATGSISLTILSGTAPFTYSWNTGENTSQIEQLSSGVYTVTVTDATGCSNSSSYYLSEPPALNITAEVVNENNGNTDGAIDLTVIGGQPDYTFLWSHGAVTEDLSGLSAGIYKVVVNDVNGCSIEGEFAVEGLMDTLLHECLIMTPNVDPDCGSAENTLSAESIEFTTYSWSVSSTDGNWQITDGQNANQITYSAGTENSQATFTLVVTDAAGNQHQCKLSLNACTNNPDNSDDGLADNSDNTNGDNTDDSSTEDGTSTDDNSDGTDNSDSTNDPNPDDGSTDLPSDGTEGDSNQEDPIVDEPVDNTEEENSGNDSADDEIDEGTDQADSEDETIGEGPDNDEEDTTDNSGGSEETGEQDENTSDNPEQEEEANIHDNDCSDDYTTSLIKVSSEGSCMTYEFSVIKSATVVYDLSHISFEVKSGDIISVTNSEGYPVEIGNTDPKTQISGFKVDEVKDFDQELIIVATICHQAENYCWNPVIAYKSGSCISYETLEIPCQNLTQLVDEDQLEISTYPNPAAGDFSITFNPVADQNIVVELFNQEGHKIRTLYAGFVTKDSTKSIEVSTDDLPNGTYIYKITGQAGVITGKILLAR